MTIISEAVIKSNTGKTFPVKKGQVIRVIGESTADFVVFNLRNVKERFDQARTKVDQGKIYVTTGDLLISKFNNVMMTIVADTYRGTHDMEKGMCSTSFYKKKEDVPSPLNIFQTMVINAKTGSMRYAMIRPRPGGDMIDLRAEMDCLVGISACPEGGRGKDLRVAIYKK